jgi:hypothetical protein
MGTNPCVPEHLFFAREKIPNKLTSARDLTNIQNLETSLEIAAAPSGAAQLRLAGHGPKPTTNPTTLL